MRYSTVMAVAAVAALVLTGPGAADEEQRERAGGGQSQVQVQSSVGGTITIIGPDGKVMTHSFGDASSQARRPAADADARDTAERKDGRGDGKAGTTKSFRWGKTLRITPEGGLEILDEEPDTEHAAERARDAADRARRDAGPTSDREADRAAGIERKLDAILDRLEMLERDVRALKGVDRNRE